MEPPTKIQLFTLTSSNSRTLQNLETVHKPTSQLRVDPDGILTQEDREIFHQLHSRYVHLFSPQPGRYNGQWGYVDNKLNFSTPPPPNSKTHIPNYSPAMNKLMEEKMDLLEKWGVLAIPEKVGSFSRICVPLHVSAQIRFQRLSPVN